MTQPFGPWMSPTIATDTIQDGAVTEGKLAAASVSAAKLAADLEELADGSFTDLHFHSVTEGTPVNAVNAAGTLTLTGVPLDGEIVTIGSRVYEIDTDTVPAVTAGRVPVLLQGGSTRVAQGTLTLDTNPTAGDTMTLGAKVYTFDANGALTNVDGRIEIGANLAATKINVRNAINLTGTPGTGYAALMTVHPSVTMAAFIGDAAVISAKRGGTAGNAIVTTETFTAVSNVFDAGTLGTTQAGVNPTAPETVTALVTAISGDASAVVTAVDGAGDTVVVTAITAGAAGNSIVSTDTLANGSWGAGVLGGGVDGTVGEPWEQRVDASYLYQVNSASGNSISGKNWRRISLSTAY